MLVGRSEAKTAVLNNRIYVIGGSVDNDYLTSACEYYDPSQNKWTKISDMIEASAESHVCSLNNFIYVFECEHLSSIRIQIYNAELDTWKKVTFNYYLFYTEIHEKHS